jgi:hypothetical protein
MICLSCFLLAISAVALTFGLLFVNDTSWVSELFGMNSDTNDDQPDNNYNSQDDVIPPVFAPTSAFLLFGTKEAPTMLPPLSPDSPQPPLKTPIVSEPTVAREEIQVHLLSVIANHSISSLDVINVTNQSSNNNNNIFSSTPQSLAYHWMLNDPIDWNHSNATILQRWVLAIFYYSTGGKDWQAETLSLERNPFSGTIPSQWEDLLRLDSFSIQENKITGQMPEGICQIGNFTYLKADCVDEISCLCCTECF